MKMFKTIHWKAYLTDIRFWLVLFFLVRLTGITNPPLEIGHNWRQSLTDMIARNMMVDGEFFLPKINMAGNHTGIIGSEFPLFNGLIALFDVIFGYQHWYGRLINLLVSTVGIFYFYQSAEKLFDKKTAFYSAMVLLVSLWFAFSRKIMPDTFSVALVMVGLYHALRYATDGKYLSLFLFFVFGTLGILCKLPALSLYAVLVVMVLHPDVRLRQKIIFSATVFVSVVVVAGWYFYYVPYLLETYRYQLYFPKGLAEGWREMMPLLPEAAEKFYFSSLQSFVALGCCILGLFFFLKESNRYKKMAALCFCTVFLLFTLKTGAVFPLHNYYIIPFTPFMALMAGYLLAKVPQKIGYALLCIIVVEGIANQQHDFFIPQDQKYKLDLVTLGEKYTKPEDLIIINGGQNPQQIYFTNRKGWTVSDSVLADPPMMNQMVSDGARYIFQNKKTSEVELPYSKVYTNENWVLYKP
jgi:4-amino-4-deoxy-L-arabinose transferase-like glycosyltransferase